MCLSTYVTQIYLHYHKQEQLHSVPDLYPFKGSLIWNMMPSDFKEAKSISAFQEPNKEIGRGLNVVAKYANNFMLKF